MSLTEGRYVTEGLQKIQLGTLYNTFVGVLVSCDMAPLCIFHE
jgi:hypothetical protein